MFDFLNPYKAYLIAGAGAAAFISGMWIGYHWGSYNAEENKKTAVEAQKNADKEQCTRSQQITGDVDNALQNNLDRINGRITTGMLPANASCASVQLSSGSGSNNESGRTKHAGPNGLSTGWLKQFAANGETYRVKLMACQSLLTAERK